MDVLLGAVFVIGMIFLFAAISDAKQKSEMKELEKKAEERRIIEEKRQEELRKQLEEQAFNRAINHMCKRVLQENSCSTLFAINLINSQL